MSSTLCPIKVGMVLDLTNSYRYYNFNDEFPDAEGKEIAYRKVCARGVKSVGRRGV